MKEESTREGIHANGSLAVWDFRYELVMLQTAPFRSLAISQGTPYCGCEDCGRSGEWWRRSIYFHLHRVKREREKR